MLDNGFGVENMEYDVTCARCKRVLSCNDAFIEEGDEWECRTCWVRCNKKEKEAANRLRESEII